MKITEITVTRKVFVPEGTKPYGPSQSHEITIKAELSAKDDPVKVRLDLDSMICEHLAEAHDVLEMGFTDEGVPTLSVSPGAPDLTQETASYPSQAPANSAPYGPYGLQGASQAAPQQAQPAYAAPQQAGPPPIPQKYQGLPWVNWTDETGKTWIVVDQRPRKKYNNGSIGDRAPDLVVTETHKKTLSNGRTVNAPVKEWYFVNPQGSFNTDVIEWAQSLGFVVDPQDPWKFQPLGQPQPPQPQQAPF